MPGTAQRHLEHSDYYDEHRRVQGEWHGRGAELLGLRGEVTQKQFEAVREGLHPETGEFLRPRHSADRISPDGSEQSKGRSMYDLTFSAPKSVSFRRSLAGMSAWSRLTIKRSGRPLQKPRATLQHVSA